MSVTNRYKVVVIGASSGGIAALNVILDELPADFPLPVVAVLHIQETTKADFSMIFRRPGRLLVREAEEKQKLEKGVLYLAPPGYHLLVETDGTLSLSFEDKVNFSRPSVDVLFESAASAYDDQVIAVVLTGANSDGAVGLKAIKQSGGLTIVQDPKTAETRSMPDAAIAMAEPHHVASLSGIAALLRTEAQSHV